MDHGGEGKAFPEEVGGHGRPHGPDPHEADALSHAKGVLVGARRLLRGCASMALR